MTLPLTDAIERFKDNESRVNDFVNGEGYTTTGGEPVESLPNFLERQEQEIQQTTGTVSANLAASNSAKVAAEAARDAAQLSAGVYASTSAGLAAVAEGAYFSVPGTDASDYLILYKKVSGAAVEQRRYPTLAGVDKRGQWLKTQLINGQLKNNGAGTSWIAQGPSSYETTTDPVLTGLGITTLGVFNYDNLGSYSRTTPPKNLTTGSWVAASVIVVADNWDWLTAGDVRIVVWHDTGNGITPSIKASYQELSPTIRRFFGVVEDTLSSSLGYMREVSININAPAGHTATIKASGFAIAASPNKPIAVDWLDDDPYSSRDLTSRVVALETSGGAPDVVLKTQIVDGHMPSGRNTSVQGKGTTVAITDAYLNGLGIGYARELATLTTVQDTYGRLSPPRPYKSGDWVAVSCLVKASDWADLEPNRQRIQIYPTSGGSQVVAMSYVQISSSIRRYYGVVQLAAQHNPVLNVLIEIAAKANCSSPVYVTGYAAAFSEGKPLAVDWADFDPYKTTAQDKRLDALEASIGSSTTSPGLLVPSSLHLVQDYPITFYRSGLSERRDNNTMDFAFVGSNGSRQGVEFVERAVKLDGRQFSGAGAVWARTRDDDQNVFKKPVTFYSSAGSKTGSPKILVIGDSLTQQGTVTALKNKLTAAGLTPNFIGTLKDDGGTLCEGRPSWEFSDFTRKYLFTDPSNPISGGTSPTYPIDATGGDGIITAVSTYLALGDSANYGPRWRYNPFIRPSQAGDEASFVKNGYIFDMRFYLNRFSFADPDIVMIALGTNDQASNSQSVGQANCVEGLNILYTQIRAALPNAKIGIVVNSYSDQAKWSTSVLPWIKYVLTTYGAREAESIFVLPVYMTMDPKFIYGITVGSTNTYGVQQGTVADWVHFDAVGKGQWADMTYAFVMNRV